ncbi:Six-hairpin glycosidase [Cadophora sp. MPI-SDFR-AT-0126]|nr:Six-hairpin glycosidase [Leotiomycetes sp. MPI-SDFR-AT-0126]
MKFQVLVSALLLYGSFAGAAKFDQYILAATSRTIIPVSVYNVNGSVIGAQNPILGGYSKPAKFQDVSAVTYDFGKNIGGIVSFTVSQVTGKNQFIGVTFSESSMWISGESSDGSVVTGLDAPLWFPITGLGVYKAHADNQRGGFRYMSLIHNSTGTVELDAVSIQFTAMPHWPDNGLKNYSGYFNCDDELLNRIWYAGAYTCQLCTIDPKHGNTLNDFTATSFDPSKPIKAWYANTTISNGSSTLVDGAKRDRLIWPGDMTIELPTVFVSTNDLPTIRDGIDLVFQLQQHNGALPYVGLQAIPAVSDTYHLHGLGALYSYYMYSGDKAYVQSLWNKWKLGLEYSINKTDSSGLMNVTLTNDWGRLGQGGHNIAANAFLFHTIQLGLQLASSLNDDAVTTRWAKTAAGIEAAANKLLWDDGAKMYRDNETTTLMPQDGNVWAIVSGLADTPSKKQLISAALTKRWGKYGAISVEIRNYVAPFIGSVELWAHALAGNHDTMHKLIRLQWGFMLDGQRMTNSTFIEGYDANGVLTWPGYEYDQRVSHAHGWATGPTSALTFYTAGLQILSAGGKTWRIAPGLANLSRAEAGFETPLGQFSVSTKKGSRGEVSVSFSTPAGTSGEVWIPKPNCKALLSLQCPGQRGRHMPMWDTGKKGSLNERYLIVDNLPTGNWQAEVKCLH